MATMLSSCKLRRLRLCAKILDRPNLYPAYLAFSPFTFGSFVAYHTWLNIHSTPTLYMAEVLGPFGFAFGAIGFIFSTVGTVTEAWDNLHEYEEQMSHFQLRLGEFDQKINKWNIFWRNTDFGPYRAIINATKVRVEKLCEDMKRKLRKHLLTDEGLWKILVLHWQQGKRLKLKDLGRDAASISTAVPTRSGRKRS